MPGRYFTHFSVSPQESIPLTLNHFLNDGQIGEIFAPGTTTEVAYHPLK